MLVRCRARWSGSKSMTSRRSRPTTTPSVAVAMAPSEVVDADNPRRWRPHGGRVAAPQNPKCRVAQPAQPKRRQTGHHAQPAYRPEQPPPQPPARRNDPLYDHIAGRSLTVLPLIGRPESVRSYQLRMDGYGIAQSGQFAPAAAKRPEISTIPSLTVWLSTVRPGSRG